MGAWRLKVAIPCDLYNLPRVASFLPIVFTIGVWFARVVFIRHIVPVVPPLFGELFGGEVCPLFFHVTKNGRTGSR